MDRSQRLELNRLMADLADGKRSAFRPLFQSALPVVQRFATRFLGDPVEADDAAQAAMLKVFERASTFRAGAEAMTWILTIAAYECRTIRQRTRRRRIDPASETVLAAVAHDTGTPEQAAVGNDLTFKVRDLLEGLSDVDQSAILVVLEDRERPDVDGATFRKRLQRALRRFKKTWEAEHGDA